MATQEQILAILMFGGALVSVIAASYMVYTSFQDIQKLKAQAMAVSRYVEKIIPSGNR